MQSRPISSHFNHAPASSKPPAAASGLWKRLAIGWQEGQVIGVQLTLPESVEATLSPQAAALHLAIGLFVTEEVTLGQAAEIAGMSQTAFLKELGVRRIPIHYGRAELEEDLRVVESIAGQ